MDLAQISRNLFLGDDGIWRSPKVQNVSYSEDGHALCSQVEDDSFWFKHRNKCIAALIDQFPPKDRATIFDVGGGNGFVSRGLSAAGYDAVLIEPGEVGAKNAKQSGLPTVVCSTLADADFSENALPAIGLFDVVEHVEDDIGFLQHVHSLLAPGGKVYLTVPAYNLLWSAEDEVAGHFRRYSIRTLTALVGASGLKTEFATYIFRPLPLPVLLFRTIPSALGLGNKKRQTNAMKAKNDHSPPGTLARLLIRSLTPEIGRISQLRPMSFGASLLLAATKD